MKHPKNSKISKDEMDNAVTELNSFLSSIKSKYNLNSDQIQNLLHDVEKIQYPNNTQVDKEEKNIPVCIFNNSHLSCLEAIVKYLRENICLKYSEIAILLKRDAGPIGVTYRNAKKKMPAKFIIKPCASLPTSTLADRKLSPLENIVSFFKNKGMRYSEIAAMLNRDDRTIWTVSKRAELKSKSKTR